MPFDLKTAIPVKEAETNDLVTQQFDISTATSISLDPKTKLTGYEGYVKQDMDRQIKEAILQPLSASDLEGIVRSEVETPNALFAGIIPYVKGAAGFFTRPFGVEPFGDTFTPEEIEAARGEHPVASTIGEIIGGVAPFLVAAPLFPQSMLGLAGTFGTVSGISKIGEQQVAESIMTPIGKKALDVSIETLKGAAFAPIWHFSAGLSFIGRPYASALLRAGTRGAGSASLIKVFGGDLEQSLRQGGLITALSLIFESPALIKTALGRGIVKQVEARLNERGIPTKPIPVEKVDIAAQKESLFRLVRGLNRAMKTKTKAPLVTPQSQKFLKIPDPVELSPSSPLVAAQPPVPTAFKKLAPEIQQQLTEFVKTVDLEKIQEAIEASPETQQALSELGVEPKQIKEFFEQIKGELEPTEKVVTKEPEALVKEIDKAIRAGDEQKLLTFDNALVRKRKTTLIKQSIKDVAKGIREGKKFAKVQVKAVQEELSNLLKVSDLETKDKAKFISAIKNVQTAQQLSKVLPQIEERIAQLEETAAKRKFINAIRSETRKQNIRKLRPEFKSKILDLVESIDLKNRSDKKIRELQSLTDFLQQEPENNVPQKKIDELKSLGQKQIGDLSLEDLKLVSDSIDHLVKLNELKNKIIVKNKLRDFEKVRNESIDNVNQRHEKSNGSLDGLDSEQQEQEAGVFAKIFGADSYNAELKTEILDGAEAGTIKEVIFNGIDRGTDDSFRFLHTAEDFFKDKLKGLDMDSWSRAFERKESKIGKVTVKISGGRTLTMTKGERIAFNLHANNLSNRRHLENGGFAFSQTLSKIIKLTPEDVDTIALSLTKEELRAADAINEYLNTIQKDAINKVSVDLDGIEIATEINYFPIRTNFLDRVREVITKKGKYAQKTLEGQGIFKERQAATNAIILEDAFLTVYKSIKQVSGYVGLAKPLRSAKTLLQDNEFQISVRDIGRKNYVDSLTRYLEQVEGDSIRLNNVDKLTQALINKLDTSILGINPFVMFKQPVSYFGASTEMSAKLLAGQSPLQKPTTEQLAEMRKWAPQIRDRLDGNVTRELGEVAEVGRPKRFFTGKEVASQKTMAGIRSFDTRTISAIWRAVKAEVSQAQPDLKGDAFLERVGERAWEVIRKTQPTFHIKDRSTIGASKNVFTRLLTKYSSQRNKNYMIIRRAFDRYNRSSKRPRDKSRLASAVFIVAVLNSLLIVAVNAVRGLAFSKGETKNIYTRMITDFITTTLGSVYFLGDFANSVLSKIDKGTYAGFDVNNPVSSFMDEMGDTIANGVRSITQSVSGEKFLAGKNKGEKKWVESLKKFSTGMLDGAGRIKGFNVKIVRKFLEAALRPFIKEPSKGRPKIGG